MAGDAEGGVWFPEHDAGRLGYYDPASETFAEYDVPTPGSQPYAIAVAQDDINYRRFFDINGLAALRQENRATFDVTHRLVCSLVKSGAVDALRVDHPDGLYDPREYFRRLQEACGKPIYVAVEKIVAPFENLREDWPVHGTTGYRFANVVNGLFVDTAAESRITRAYQAFIGEAAPFADLLRLRWVVQGVDPELGLNAYEQTAYAEIADGEIVRMRLACSGHRPL